VREKDQKKKGAYFLDKLVLFDYELIILGLYFRGKKIWALFKKKN
jgi:hypothetical protein